MFDFFRNLFSPPLFPEDDEKTRVAKILNTLTWVLFLLPIIAVINMISVPANVPFLMPVLIFAIISLSLIIISLKRGSVTASSVGLVVFALVTFGYLIFNIAGASRPILTIIASAVVLGGLVLGGWGAMISALAIIIISGIVANLAANGYIQSATAEPSLFNIWFISSAGYLILGLLLTISANSLQDALKRANANQENLKRTNLELLETQNNLEQRVEQRTAELTKQSTELAQISSQLEKRASGLRAVALVGREIASIERLEELLPRIADVTARQFGFYHVGIFILEQENTIAALKATNSEGGRRMLARNHRLKVGQVGIVGYVSATGRPRIALNTGSDAVFFDNPDLPQTRSEMALPLKIANEVIGVLDVQSEEENAFSNEDTELLTIVADQVSIAIQNARLFEESQKSIAEAQAITRQYVREEWQSTEEETALGYRFSQSVIRPITTPVAVEKTECDMLIPIKLHDQTIGTLRLQPMADRKWDRDTMDIAQAVADRVALAVENARLLERSQSQAARERTVGQITAKIGASVNMRNVLQTAVEELGRVLPGSDVTIQIENSK